MELKKIRKDLIYLLGWIALQSCSLIIKLTPRRFLYSMAGMLGALAFKAAKKQRRIAIQSLTVAFGNEKSGAEIEAIARDCFLGMVKAAFELFFLMERPELLRRSVDIEGLKYLQEARSLNKGVILVSAHFGNFPLLMAKLSLEGFPTAGIMKPMKDKRVEGLFLRKRSKLKIKTIYSVPRNTCVFNSLQALRQNELVFIPLDQNFGTGGVYVKFFGKSAATATGPVIMARRTGAAILPCFIIRLPDNRHRIIFEPAFHSQGESGEQADVTADIQRLTTIIEAYIRKYPAEWGWIHRRWKSQESKQ